MCLNVYLSTKSIMCFNVHLSTKSIMCFNVYLSSLVDIKKTVIYFTYDVQKTCVISVVYKYTLLEKTPWYTNAI